MRNQRRLLAAIATLTLLIGLDAAATGSTVESYLKIRKQDHYNPYLTIERAESDAGRFANTPFEITGTLTGCVQQQNGTTLIMITLPDKRTLTMNAPLSESRFLDSNTGIRMRLLVHLNISSDPNTIGASSGLDVLAATYEDELKAIESKKHPQKSLIYTRSLAGRRTTNLPSRSEGIPIQQGSAQLSTFVRTYLTPEAQAVYPYYYAYIAHTNPHLSAAELQSITVSLLHFSERFRVDPRLVVAMIIAESDFHPNSTSYKGAMGLGQLMPFEAKALHLTNPYDPIENIKGMIDLLRGKLDIFREMPHGYTWGQVIKAVAAYNAGAGAVKKYGGIPPYKETEGYVRRVVSIYLKLIGYSK